MTLFELMGYEDSLEYSGTASKTDLYFALVYGGTPTPPSVTFKPIIIMIY